MPLAGGVGLKQLSAPRAEGGRDRLLEARCSCWIGPGGASGRRRPVGEGEMRETVADGGI